MLVNDQVRLRWWMPKYYWVVSVMGYDTLKDREAVKVLSELLSGVEPPITDLLRAICGRDVIVFGAGPSLDAVVRELTSSGILSSFKGTYSLLAADGATQALLEYGLVPDVVVTDLDGDIHSIFSAALKGSLIVVHGHGDNVVRLRRYVGELVRVTRRLVGTVQVEPEYPVMNFGGFTDGDRAVFMVEYFGARRVFMAGMDFGEVVGRRSKPWLKGDVMAWGEKKLKLWVAKELISWLVRERGIEVFTLSEDVPDGVRRVGIRELSSLLGSR